MQIKDDIFGNECDNGTRKKINPIYLIYRDT